MVESPDRIVTAANTRQDTNSNTRQSTQVDESNVFSSTHQLPDVYLPDRSNSNTHQVINPSDAFNYEAQLLRLETYKDRYGRTICKRTVRFVRKRTGKNIGEITPEIAEALKKRPGKGRTKEARAEAERNRLLAESLAKRLRRTQTGRRSFTSGKHRSGRKAGNQVNAFGSELLSNMPDLSRDKGVPYLH